MMVILSCVHVMTKKVIRGSVHILFKQTDAKIGLFLIYVPVSTCMRKIDPKVSVVYVRMYGG